MHELLIVLRVSFNVEFIFLSKDEASLFENHVVTFKDDMPKVHENSASRARETFKKGSLTTFIPSMPWDCH